MTNQELASAYRDVLRMSATDEQRRATFDEIDRRLPFQIVSDLSQLSEEQRYLNILLQNIHKEFWGNSVAL